MAVLASNVTGDLYPKAECRRLGLYKPSMYRPRADSAADHVWKLVLQIISDLIVLNTVSTMALSKQFPLPLIEGTISSAFPIVDMIASKGQLMGRRLRRAAFVPRISTHT